MATTQIHDVVQGLEKANANLEADLLPVESARELFDEYAKVKKLAAYGEAMLASRIDDAAAVARATGTSMGVAKRTVETGVALKDAPEVGDALACGEVSLDQAAQITKAEQAKPGSAGELLKVAKEESFHVLRDQARRVKLEAEQHTGLGERQRQARSARSYNDDLGMVDIHLRFQPRFATSWLTSTTSSGRVVRPLPLPDSILAKASARWRSNGSWAPFFFAARYRREASASAQFTIGAPMWGWSLRWMSSMPRSSL